MSYTLFFEEIAKTTSVVNKDSIPRWPESGHANASGWQTSIKFRKGRYGQTTGNRIGDVSPGMKACLYHMPRNSYRFDEARLKVHKKNIGDPIEASDINNLIDKIKLFQHIWEAEANNIEAYGPVGSGADTISASISNNWNSATTVKTADANGSLTYSIFSSDDTKGKYDPTCYIYINGVEKVRSTTKNQTLSGTLSFNKNDEIKLYIDRGPSAHPNITATLYYDGVGGLITSSNNITVSTTPLKYINSDGGDTNQFPLITRNSEVTIPKDEVFACVTGDNSNAVLTELYRHKSDSVKVGSKFNNPLMYGFPEYLDDFDVTGGEHGSGGFVNTGVIIHGGFAPIIPVAPIMFKVDDKISQHYKLKYLAGDKANTIVKDRNGTDIIFKSDIPQIISYRRDNQPDTKLFYFGYILYYLANTMPTPGTIREVVTYSEKQQTIVSRAELIPLTGWARLIASRNGNQYNYYPASSTPEITIDLKVIFGFPITQLFFNGYYSNSGMGTGTINQTKFLAWLNSLSDTTITIPEQRINDGRYQYRKPGTSTWVNCSGIYSLAGISPAHYQYYNTRMDWDSENMLYSYGVDLEFICNRPLENEQKLYDAPGISTTTWAPSATGPKWFWSWSGGWGTGDYIVDTTLFSNFITFCEQHLGYSNSVTVTNQILYPVANFACSYIYIYGDEYTAGGWGWTYYKSTGPTDAEKAALMEEYGSYWTNAYGWGAERTDYVYTIDYGCPIGATEEDGMCKMIEVIDESNYTGLVDNDTNNLIIFEKDYTYIKPRVFVGGKYPLIYGNDFKSVRTVLKDYLHAVLVTSQLGINCGTPDSATMMELNGFFGSQDATGNAFDRDNPETTFVGYHALSGGIIKLDFYNILVDAYKLLINSCICNADCACNLVCICNTNCGCNYSG